MSARPAQGYRLTWASATRTAAVVATLALPLQPAWAAAPHHETQDPAGSPAQEAGPPAGVPGSELTVYLVTIGVGAQVWERFGHNAIRIRDELRNRDVAYNWGLFSFSQEGFFIRFLAGDWQYWMDGLLSQPMIEAYAGQDRTIVQQELDLTPAERLELLNLVESNRLPENRFYRYQYFLDNCSTRVRDVLDLVLGGAITTASTDLTGNTFRFHTRRLTEIDPVIYVMLDFFMGGRGDRPITERHEMFIPMLLRDYVRELRRDTGDGGGSRPLVGAEEILYQADRDDEPAEPTGFMGVSVATGVLLAIMVVGLAMLAVQGGAAGSVGRLGFVVTTAAWSSMMGVAGLIIIVSHFTDHEFMHWNENLLQANPLSLALLVLLPGVLRRTPRQAARKVALAVAGLAVLGFVAQVLPGIDQVNGYYLAVAVPVHLAVAWGLGVVASPERPS